MGYIFQCLLVMYKDLSKASVIRQKFVSSIVLLSISVTLIISLASCLLVRPGQAIDHQDILWEGWEVIESSYVGWDSIDNIEVTGNTIKGMLEQLDKPAYPFLTELDDVIDQPPVSVPDGLADIWRAWTLSRAKWPDVDPSLLTEAAMKGMMQSLGDPVSNYLNQVEFKKSQQKNLTSYEGIGAVVDFRDSRLTIFSVMSDGPAQKVGLQRDDVILEIDGEPVYLSNSNEAVKKLKGASGTRVTLLIQRSRELEPRDIVVTRGTINIPTVDMSLLPSSVGYLYIREFQDHTLDEVLEVLETFNELDTLGIILDLRNNHNGGIEVARDVGAQFLPDGLFLYEIDGNNKRTDMFIEAGGTLTEGSELVVLINKGTAQAAEALAGSLQDAGVGIVIGDRSKGLGSTNIYSELSNGGAILLPVSYWYTPSGRSIIIDGIVPDIDASLSKEDFALNRDSQLKEAYDYLDKRLPAFR